MFTLQELVDLEARLRNGGLGGVADFMDWERKVLAADTLPALGSLMTESMENILGKFLKGMLTQLGKKPKSKNLDETSDSLKEDEEEDSGEPLSAACACLWGMFQKWPAISFHPGLMEFDDGAVWE